MRKSIICAVALGFTFPAAADTPLWSEMALEDVAAAYELIAENHPGAAEAHGDTDFQQNLATGYANARSLAESANSFEDYRAALNSFTSVFGDAHIWTSRKLAPITYSWPGFLVDIEAGHYVSLGGPGIVPQAGARLISCDGMTPTEMEELTLAPYTTGWGDAGMRSVRAVRLLLDRRDFPFEPYESCTFLAADEEPVQVAMQWSEIYPEDLSAYINERRKPVSRDVAMLDWDHGIWFRFGRLDDDVRQIVDGYTGQLEQLSNAGNIVVDLRGNGGGNSAYTTQLAKMIYGTSAVEVWLESAAPENSASYWRVSDDNLKTLYDYRERFGKTEQAKAHYTRQIEAMEEALETGAPFSSPLAEANDEDQDSGPVWPAPADAPNVYLITDEYCFSSCLIATREFRGMGAVHIGAITSSNTHYSEVREVVLPSGLSTFSTLQAVIGSMPMRVGPFEPAIEIDKGVLSDDEALRARVTEIVGK